MHRTPIAIAVASAIGLGLGLAQTAVAVPKNVIPASVKSVEFFGIPAPETDEERATTYSGAMVEVTYANGETRSFRLEYKKLHDTLDQFNGVTVGDLYDVNGDVLLDLAGEPQRSETPDANSLLQVPDAESDSPRKRRLFLVTHHEYDWLDMEGNDNYGKQPMTMNLAAIDQDKKSGVLETAWVKNIDMAGIRGLWIPCAGSKSPWNTHLGSEEYEPDARCAEKPDDFCASTPSYTSFNDPANFLNLDSMNRYLAPAGMSARVYDYGIVPEVIVDSLGNARVEGHRALGRISRELVDVMPDQRTVYQGDDGTYNVMTMFVADNPGDLSAGTLYAAKWNQTSEENVDGGEATLRWYKLGHASNAEIEAMVNSGIKFSDIFETSQSAAPGFTTIKAGHNTWLVEHLKLKVGMERAAAFLETRRYAAYVGATTEFEKFEGVTHNAADKKVYVAMTRMRSGMQASATDPVDHIRIPRNNAGAVYEIDLAGGQTDADDNLIDSEYVGVAMRALVLGEAMAADTAGNTAVVDKIASPDNIKYSEKMRTLFIGEDSSLHVNNFVWAYNVDTGKLSRILSIPAGAEATGLQVIDDMNGQAYIMANYQHAGDFTSTTSQAIKDNVGPLIDKYQADVGYLGGLPGLK